MTNFSPNMLKTFATCPQKYWFKYIQKISMPQKSSTFEKGKKIHALANYYLRGDDIAKLETALNNEEKQVWEKLKQNEFFQKTYFNSEYNLSCKVDKYWVGGRLDAVVFSDEIYYILDYKTGAVPKNPEYDFQTMVYSLCLNKKLSKISNVSIKFVYIDLKNDKNYVIDFKSEKEYSDLITKICQKIENYQPAEEIKHSKMCEFCEYRKICI
jgi:CRISPR/Cas system-associated exonuclease Cas4 (RecB family)